MLRTKIKDFDYVNFITKIENYQKQRGVNKDYYFEDYFYNSQNNTITINEYYGVYEVKIFNDNNGGGASIAFYKESKYLKSNKTKNKFCNDVLQIFNDSVVKKGGL
ncbi:MAG: hypothetical protein LBC06_01065 [Rickettsiales bacterium]|jgi:hypothetical protein|nr:hypothetical protein [Rickettsiales bacterium]